MFSSSPCYLTKYPNWRGIVRGLLSSTNVDLECVALRFVSIMLDEETGKLCSSAGGASPGDGIADTLDRVVEDSASPAFVLLLHSVCRACEIRIVLSVAADGALTRFRRAFFRVIFTDVVFRHHRNSIESKSFCIFYLQQH